jgi:Tfp pilus assembly protein FimT
MALFFSIPFLSSLYQKNQLQVRQDEIKASIQFAKIQAQIRHKNLLLAPIGGKNDWSAGMRLFVDNAQHRYTPNAQVLHEWHWKASNISISWHGFQSDHYLLFAAENSKNAINGYFLIQINSELVIKLIVNRLGRVRYRSN